MMQPERSLQLSSSNLADSAHNQNHSSSVLEQLASFDSLSQLSKIVFRQLDQLKARAMVQSPDAPLFESKGDLIHQIDSVVTKIRTITQPMVEMIDTAANDSNFGQTKVDHMDSLREMIREYATALEIDPPLTDEEMALLELIGAVHDVGRHAEAYLRLDTLRPREKAGHGQLGAWMLLQSDALAGLSPRAQYFLLYATIYHSDREVSPPTTGLEQRGQELAYVLRDTDKYELLQSSIFGNSQGMIRQLQMHYLPEPLNVEEAEALRQYVDLWLAGLNDSSLVVPQRARIDQVLQTPINQQAWQHFIHREPIGVELIRDSWATYALLQLAVLLDVRHAVFLHKILMEDMATIGQRLRVIKRIDREKFEEIIAILADYLSGLFEEFSFEQVQELLLTASS